MLVRPQLVLRVGAFVLLGCSAELPPNADDAADTESPDASGGDADATDTGDAEQPVDSRTCMAPAGVSAAPQTIDEAVQLINALPRPVTIACLLESLERPLAVELSNSAFSAQPADGIESPRVFLFFGDLILSVVPDGDGSSLLEFGEIVDGAQTIKGELAFPVEDTLPASAPYEKIIYDENITTCGFCHRDEARIDAIDDHPVYVSGAFAPDAASLVDLSHIRDSATRCEDSSRRCEILRALFDHGEVRHQAFPEHFPTIFDP